MLKYKKLYDYIVGCLYFLKSKNEMGFFSLRDIVERLDHPSTPTEINSIGKYLEAEGHVNADFKLGDVFIEITPQGIVYIENKEDTFLPEVEEFIKQKNNGNQVNKIASKLSTKAILDSKKPIIDKLNAIIKHLGASKALKNSDFHIDAKILKLEIEKEDPDKEVISIKFMNLESLKSSKQEVSELKEYVTFFEHRHY